ncbi:hypothetical protein [Streptomyces sp. NPDC004270]
MVGRRRLGRQFGWLWASYAVSAYGSGLGFGALPLIAVGALGALRADNMVRDSRLGVTFVDWPHASRGPACIDAASLAPQLVLAGHAPVNIARRLRDHPATADHPATTTAFLAALTGHWHRNARQPAPPGAPGLRAYQQRAAAAGLALLDYHLG